MKACELLESTQTKTKLSALVRKSNNFDLLSKLLNFLKVKAKVENLTGDNKSPIAETLEDNVKGQVLKLLNQLDDDSPEWNNILDLLRKDEITSLAAQVIMNKMGAVNNRLDKKLRDLVIRADASFEEKEELLQKLANGGGYIDGKALLNSQSGNLYEGMKSSELADFLARRMAKEFRGDMGYGPDQGPGEIMMMIMGTGIRSATKGDLDINGTVVEVKASGKGKSGFSGGRLYSTSGYGTSSLIKRDFYKELVNAGISKEVLLQYGMPSNDAAKAAGVKVIKGGLHLNLSGLTNLSDLFQDQKIGRAGAQKIISVLINGLYTKLPDSMTKSMMSIVKSDGSFDATDFLIEMTKLAHVYYMGIAGHDALMVINTDSGNYAIMKSAEDVETLLRDGTVTLTAHINLDDDRSKGSSQLIIK